MKKFIVTFLLVCSFLLFSGVDTAYAEEATLNLNGIEVTNTISEENQEDVYKITLNQPGYLSLNLKVEDMAFQNSGEFKLLDENKDLIENCNVYPNIFSFGWHLKAGTYYVSINGKYLYVNGTSQTRYYGGNYTLSATVNSTSETYAESNNTLATASKAEFNKDIYGQIAFNDDVDIYRVDLSKSGKVTCNITSYLPSYQIQLCDNLGNTFVSAKSDYNQAIGCVTDTYNWDLTAGTYYIKVLGASYYQEASYGNYNFKLTFTDAQETCAEPNNESREASAISFGKKIRGQFAINDSKDVYKVVTTKKCRLFLDVTTYVPKYNVVITDGQGKSIYNAYGAWDESLGKKDNDHYVDVEAGTYYIKFEQSSSDGYGNYEFTASALNLMSECNIKVNESVYFTGSEVKVPMTITYEGYTLKEGTDYTTAYENNVNFGTATVTITGIGRYAGSVTKEFGIVLRLGSKVTVGDYIYKFLADDEVALAGIANKNLTTVNLDSRAEIGGKYFSLTEVLDKAAYQNTKITKVYLPSTVEKIGTKAFYGCTKLKLVEASSVVSISKDAFTKCSKLTKVTGIGAGSSIVIGKNCYTMKSDGTIEFTKLYSTKDTSLIVPATAKIGAASFKVTSIAAKAVDKTKIKEAVIGKYVTFIGDKAFQKCTSLKKITFKGKNITAGADVFDGCKKLKNIKGGKGSVFTVGKYKYKMTSESEAAFAGIKSNSTTKVVVPATAKIGAKTYKVTAIADYALYNTGIKSLEVGKNVKTIGAYACYSCDNLTKVMIKGKNLTIKTDAFSVCGKLKAFSGLTGSEVTIGNYKYKVTSSKAVTFKGITTDIDEVYIDSILEIGGKEFKITAIADKAFYKKDVVSVTIGSNVTKIGKQAFEKCSVLSEIRIETKKLKTVGNNAFNKVDSDVTVYVPYQKYKTYVKLLKNAGLSKKAEVMKWY